MSEEREIEASRRTAERMEEHAADRESFAAHVRDAQANGDLEGVMGGDRHPEITFAFDEDEALYSFVGDRSGLTIRCTEAGNHQEVRLLWIPSTLFGALRRALAASQEVKE